MDTEPLSYFGRLWDSIHGESAERGMDLDYRGPPNENLRPMTPRELEGRDMSVALRNLRRAAGEPLEVSGRGQDPRLTALTRALDAIGFESGVTLLIDGTGHRTLTLTPREGCAVYLNGLDIVITRGPGA